MPGPGSAHRAREAMPPPPVRRREDTDQGGRRRPGCAVRRARIRPHDAPRGDAVGGTRSELRRGRRGRQSLRPRAVLRHRDEPRHRLRSPRQPHPHRAPHPPPPPPTSTSAPKVPISAKATATAFVRMPKKSAPHRDQWTWELLRDVCRDPRCAAAVPPIHRQLREQPRPQRHVAVPVLGDSDGIPQNGPLRSERQTTGSAAQSRSAPSSPACPSAASSARTRIPWPSTSSSHTSSRTRVELARASSVENIISTTRNGNSSSKFWLIRLRPC